jgi:hypothetical protein
VYLVHAFGMPGNVGWKERMIPLINSCMLKGAHIFVTGVGGVGHYRECIHGVDELACCFPPRSRIAREREISTFPCVLLFCFCFFDHVYI